jgi:hypothetical protein
VPKAIVGDSGDTEIESRVAALTVSVADPLTEPEVAVIVDVPATTLVARP